MGRGRVRSFLVLALLAVLSACSRGTPSSPDPGTIVFLIETYPASLDPRIATDAQSQYIQGLLFNSLVRRNGRMEVVPDLATRWEIPDPRTYVFHLRPGVRFHDGRPLTAADVRYTFESLLSGKVASVKATVFQDIQTIETPDPQTVTFRLKEPFAAFLWNLVLPGMGIVPDGSGKEFARKPVGSGPYRFVRSKQEEEIVVERNPAYFRELPKIERVRFRVVPEAITRALELERGSADIALNSLAPDMIPALAKNNALRTTQSPGTTYAYIAMNLDDPVLARREVRQALAYSIDRPAILRSLFRGQGRLADNILPPNHWAYEADIRRYDYDPDRARALLDAARLLPDPHGVRFTVTIKTSTEESSRLLAAVLQDQLSRVGIRLEIRSLEFATFYSDITRGSFQLYTLRWIGGNNDPDIFDYAFHSARIPPRGANRGHFRNAEVDRWLASARSEADLAKQKVYYSCIQKMLAEDLPYISLWYLDNVAVTQKRLGYPQLDPGGNFDFLETIEFEP